MSTLKKDLQKINEAVLDPETEAALAKLKADTTPEQRKKLAASRKSDIKRREKAIADHESKVKYGGRSGSRYSNSYHHEQIAAHKREIENIRSRMAKDLNEALLAAKKTKQPVGEPVETHSETPEAESEYKKSYKKNFNSKFCFTEGEPRSFHLAVELREPGNVRHKQEGGIHRKYKTKANTYDQAVRNAHRFYSKVGLKVHSHTDATPSELTESYAQEAAAKHLAKANAYSGIDAEKHAKHKSLYHAHMADHYEDEGDTTKMAHHRRKAEAYSKAAGTEVTGYVTESAPPDMEKWVLKNKARFKKQYGEKKGEEILYATAQVLHNKKKAKAE